MPESGTSDLIRRLAAVYPRPPSALLPALHRALRSEGAVTRRNVRAVAEALGISSSRAWGAATYYSMFRAEPAGKYHLQVDTGVPAMLAGSDAVLAALEEGLGLSAGGSTEDGLFTLTTAEDLGAGAWAPALLVNDTLCGHMSASRSADLVRTLREGRHPSPVRPMHCVSVCSSLVRDVSSRPAGGTSSLRYHALEIARRMKPEEIVTAVSDSGLRGRGGAGYPTGRKWHHARSEGRPVYLICNADEGEPGTFKDRYLLENDPHLLLEGITIAARALGSKTVFVYVRGEYRLPGASLEKAVTEARRSGHLEGLDIVVHYGAGSYLCGEETALISSLEGGRGEPRPKPPYPVESGLYGSPTVVNNVETLSALVPVLTAGPPAFREKTPLLFSVCGHVRKPGLYEYPLGTPLAELLDAAGGVRGKLKAVFVGGLTSGILPAPQAERLALDYDACGEAGTSLGSGAIIAVNDTVPLARVAARASAFFAGESCGLCAPCREGTAELEHILSPAREKAQSPVNRQRVLDLCRTLAGTSLCPGGASFGSSLEALLTRFPQDFI